MKKKLLSRRGETIAEVLVAVLLIMIASAAFAAMVSSASTVNATAEAQDEKLYTAFSAAELQADETGTAGTVTVTGVEPFDVYYYSDSDGNLYSYALKTGGGAG